MPGVMPASTLPDTPWSPHRDQPDLAGRKINRPFFLALRRSRNRRAAKHHDNSAARPLGETSPSPRSNTFQRARPRPLLLRTCHAIELRLHAVRVAL
jgi:hypothetical protein